MNAIEALRLADPARADATEALRPDDEQMLQRILATPVPPAEAGSSPRRRRDPRPVVVTVAVAAVVAVLAVVVIRLGSQAPHVASTAEPTVPTITTELRQALARVFPEAFDGRATMTWTDASPGSQGDGPVDLTDEVPAYAAACEGGGSIAIRVTGQPDRTVGCDRLTTFGPEVLDLTSTGNGVGFSVAAVSGHPRYLVRLTAIAPVPTATPTRPAAARTCVARDLALVADRMGGALGTDYGSISIMNHGASACSLRGWPTAYLTDRAGGARIGAAARPTSARNGSPESTVTLAAHGGRARIDVSVVNIGGYSNGDGTYDRTCGSAVTGTGWMLTLPGTSAPVYVPFTPSSHALCSSPTLSISSVSEVQPFSAE